MKTGIFRGMMDGWHGDEDECNGDCGRCWECELLNDSKADQLYEGTRYEDNDD